jgi:hypothetical protein
MTPRWLSSEHRAIERWSAVARADARAKQRALEADHECLCEKHGRLSSAARTIGYRCIDLQVELLRASVSSLEDLRIKTQIVARWAEAELDVFVQSVHDVFSAAVSK